ncbi:hypothetical protein CLV51_107218 [Chitinophaga niastensis]|uniref:Uncharacterized protein n=1 Tax=Chitinophaga niastensis TaxID=536980 RepID=A0A2P8HCE8_CHINA|nr:hypothetical protein CLV51_107218 [Chitinophaga niastensis]
MELQLKIIGVVLIFLSIIHIVFPKYFNWKKELQPLSLINSQMMYVHTFFVALMVFLIGVLCLCCTHDIIFTKLGRQISLGLFVFWGIRLVFQFFVYSPELWKGKLFETVVHVSFSMLWLYLTVVFLLVYLDK